MGGRMKKFSFFLAWVLALAFLCSTGHAQFLGQLNTAKTFESGEYNVGAYLGAYEDAIALFGQFRAGISDYLDFGLKLGVLDFQWNHPVSGWEQSDAGVIFGGDLKYRLLETELRDPLDLSLGMLFEYSSPKEDWNSFSLGASLIVSKDFNLQSKNTISPYGRLNIRGERAEWEHPWWKGEHSDTDLEAGFTFGADLQIKEAWHFVGELQVDEFFGFLAGISYYIY